MDRKILVAKSYEGLPIVTEPYTVNGREYVDVRLKSGQIKKVRSYTPQEYARYNPPVKVVQQAKSPRDVLGFGEAGYIWVFKGNTYENLSFFRNAPTRFARPFGWYLPSNIEMPDPLPVDITPVKLPWEAVKLDDYHLKDEKELTAIVAEYIYEPGQSEWLGEVGDKLENVEVTCLRKIYLDSIYGSSTMYIFEDDNHNQLTWTTSTYQPIEADERYILNGKIKQLTKYRNINQTVVKNCKVKEIGSQLE